MWKVLMVEDEPFVRRTLINQIRWREFGFELVGEAEDGNEAMAFIQSKQPDLVISDIVMPGMDGLELLRQAKLVSDAKFVMLTCVNEFEYARQALEFGASGYLLKLSADEQALGQMLEKIEREL
ncbi:MAG: two-component system response regulator, partial [Paenibacillus sp.]|nr:two-component system response regulator [Paenibacillus sp.]